MAGGASPVPASEIVACANGLLHVGTRKLYPHTPLFFSTVAVPFAYDPAAPEPARWLRFLGDLWPDDQDSHRRAAGILRLRPVRPHRPAQDPAADRPDPRGKGTIARILTALVGAGNAAGPTLASLGTNFGLSPLLGKPLAVVSDARLGGGDGTRSSSACCRSAARTC